MAFMVRLKVDAIEHISGSNSCQIPNDEDGPPTVVLLWLPDPIPGLIRIPTYCPGYNSPNRLSWYNEHALNRTPSGNTVGNSCVLKLIFSGKTPAATHLATSYSELASNSTPVSFTIRSSSRVGADFIAYRGTNPKALGNFKIYCSLSRINDWLYTYTGDPCSATTC